MNHKPVPAELVFRGHDVPNRLVILAEDAPKIIASHLQAMAENYPADVFPPDSRFPDAIAGTALRTVLSAEVARLRGEVEFG